MNLIFLGLFVFGFYNIEKPEPPKDLPMYYIGEQNESQQNEEEQNQVDTIQ